MRYDRPIPGRISYRLPEFDYAAPGSFFVTICTGRRQCLFGNIVDGRMHRNSFGEIVHDEWLRTADIRPNIRLDEFVVMPNHVHGILHIVDINPGSGIPEPGGASRRDAPPPANRLKPGSLGAIIGQIKSIATKRINTLRNTSGAVVWQSRYHERVIRTEQSLHRIRAYIRNNPMQWRLDKQNPKYGLF